MSIYIVTEIVIKGENLLVEEEAAAKSDLHADN